MGFLKHSKKEVKRDVNSRLQFVILPRDVKVIKKSIFTSRTWLNRQLTMQPTACQYAIIQCTCRCSLQKSIKDCKTRIVHLHHLDAISQCRPPRRSDRSDYISKSVETSLPFLSLCNSHSGSPFHRKKITFSWIPTCNQFFGGTNQRRLKKTFCVFFFGSFFQQHNKTKKKIFGFKTSRRKKKAESSFVKLRNEWNDLRGRSRAMFLFVARD